MQRWERFDLEFADDFPVARIEAIHAHLSPDTSGSRSVEWVEWATALNGLAFRFIGCDKASKAAIASLATSVSPPQPERLRQENSLFSFYAFGLSCLEALCYGIYFVGAIADPAKVPAGVNRRDVTPSFVAHAFYAAFPNELITTRLSQLMANSEFKNWSAIRNALSHRGAPARTHYEGGGPPSGVDWNMPITQLDLSEELLPATIQMRRDWLGATVTELVNAATIFAHAHVT